MWDNDIYIMEVSEEEGKRKGKEIIWENKVRGKKCQCDEKPESTNAKSSTQKTINPLSLKLRHNPLSRGKKRILKPRKKLHITSNRTINQLSQQKPWRPEGSGMIYLKYWKLRGKKSLSDKNSNTILQKWGRN